MFHVLFSVSSISYHSEVIIFSSWTIFEINHRLSSSDQSCRILNVLWDPVLLKKFFFQLLSQKSCAITSSIAWHDSFYNLTSLFFCKGRRFDSSMINIVLFRESDFLRICFDGVWSYFWDSKTCPLSSWHIYLGMYLCSQTTILSSTMNATYMYIYIYIYKYHIFSNLLS